EGLRRWTESVTDHTRAIELQPTNLQLYTCRGRAYAELEEWQKAAEDHAVGLKLPSADQRAWFAYALLRLHLDQKETYQKACAQTAASDAAVSWHRLPWSERVLLGLLRREAEREYTQRGES